MPVAPPENNPVVAGFAVNNPVDAGWLNKPVVADFAPKSPPVVPAAAVVSVLAPKSPPVVVPVVAGAAVVVAAVAPNSPPGLAGESFLAPKSPTGFAVCLVSKIALFI